MGLFSGIGKLIGGAVKAVGKVAGIIPGVGPAVSAAASAFSAITGGGKSTSTNAAGQTTSISTAPPAAPKSFFAKLTETKLLGLPVLVWILLAVAVLGFLLWRRRR
jgi:ribose/xylose/arabinose/galactoside ABC-type transport system permease subunit